MNKKCVDCGESNPTMFYKGVNNRCKEHHRARAAKYRADNIDEVRKKDRERSLLPHRVEAREAYAKTAEGRNAHAKANFAWVERNKLKRSAHIIVGNALRDKKLSKQPCEHADETGKRCGALKVEAHHDDYTKPLEVRWLCKKHHDDHTWKR